MKLLGRSGHIFHFAVKLINYIMKYVSYEGTTEFEFRIQAVHGYGVTAVVEFSAEFMSKYKTIEWLDGGNNNAQITVAYGPDFSTSYNIYKGTPVNIVSGTAYRFAGWYIDTTPSPRIRLTP